jgi:hypothetical protein
MAESDRAGAPEGHIEIPAAVVTAAYSVLAKYGVRDALEIDGDIMRELLATAFSVWRHGGTDGVELIGKVEEEHK